MAPAGGTIPNIDPGELYKKADSAFLRGDVKEARRCCDEIIAALPNEPLAHQLLGDLLADQGKYEDALKAYYVALIEFPSSRLLQVKIERAKMALQAADKVHAEKSVSHPTDKRSLFGLSKGSR
jgi:predicted Zn-dependent protease